MISSPTTDTRSGTAQNIPAGSIHHANVWGVADEDLYTMALGEFDRVHAQGKPFFAHIMTTSNHRPYTFPAGRVDIAAGQARQRGGVHRLGDRRFHPARAQQAVVRGHRVRDHRRPLRVERRQRRAADVPLPHPVVDLLAGAHRAAARRAHAEPDRHPADDARAARHELHQPLLRPGPVRAGAGPGARLHRQLPEARLPQARPVDRAGPETIRHRGASGLHVRSRAACNSRRSRSLPTKRSATTRPPATASSTR